ncbi:MAG: heme-binding beta-barrel domain-containing protein [Actinobacteria bacterium]|jgi:hypothetical protein|nr:heme-binding beta-barrel domain-containing protein [Actinomycetota bacterium]
MFEYSSDIYTEPSADTDTLNNLGPLQPMAGIWEGLNGEDVHPFVDGDKTDTFVERYELQPIDPQTNGPQLFYGLRYHTHIVKPGEVETFHDQVGYWLFEPGANTVIHTLTIPRGMITMASGIAKPDSTSFNLTAIQGAETYGICSNRFLQDVFRTVEFHITVTINPNGTWSYEEDTVIKVRGRNEPVHHTDRNTLTKIAEPTPNPLCTK